MKTRREFLQKVTASSIVLPLLYKQSHASVSSPKEDNPLRVAIMGLGSYGNRVADAMRSCTKAKLTGVISGTPAKIKEWQTKYGIEEKNCYNYDNFHHIKDNPDIDAVYIITPNALHHPHCLGVASAGKHVICEKPMAINPVQGREMVEACNNANVKLLVGYRMHFEPKTLEIVRMRNAGEFGKILFFESLSGFRYGGNTNWRLDYSLSGGGAMMDMGIYAVNGARYMIGEEPLWVTAQEVKNRPDIFGEGIDETITFQMGFPGGAVSSCLSTYSMSHLDRFFLNGEKGFAELQPSTGYGPIEGRSFKGPIIATHITHQTVQMDEMADIILRGKQPIIPVDGEEGLKDLVIMQGIYEAVKSGGRVEFK